MKQRCGFYLAIIALSSSPVAPAFASDNADSYPSKPIRFILPNTTGTTVDTLGRTIALKMSEKLGQQIVSDNRGGAGGKIGFELAAHALPDGYNLLVTSTGVQVITPQIYKKLPYHPLNDFSAISMFATTDNILVAHPSLPATSVKELIALARKSPGKLIMANAGTGFQSHLAGVLFTYSTETNIRHVPYKGGASLIAVMANESQLTIAPAPSVMGHVRAGRLRALGTGGEKRSSLLPDVPAINETVPGFVSTGWAGLMAPSGTPKAILNKLHGVLESVLRDPATRELLERQGAEPWLTSPADMVSFIKVDYRRFGEAIRLADLKAQ
jgi:tripartite-type tricarboxylate transporter receptor subunit TctC